MARLAQVTTGLSSLPAVPGPSQGFLNDILRDETCVSFHRFQMAVWTAVLGFVFVVAVYNTLAMPNFSATLLGLTALAPAPTWASRYPIRRNSSLLTIHQDKHCLGGKCVHYAYIRLRYQQR